MRSVEELERQIASLRDRLSRLSKASLRINESLDLRTVLQGVLDSARSLTGARYGVITLLDDSGQLEDCLYSGLSSEQSALFGQLAEGMEFFEFLNRVEKPLRLRDFHSYVRALGLPEFRPPFPVSTPLTFLAAVIRHRGDRVGAIYVGEKQQEFTPEDEETLVMFASQAGLVIANARRHREEQQARADLEALVNTVPVGVLVFDGATGNPLWVNQEARRIGGGLLGPECAFEDFLGGLTIRRADGREVALVEFPMAQVLGSCETVRAEEIVVEAPDGQSLTTLVNVTPIHSEEGAVASVVVTFQDMTPVEELERLRAEFLGMVSHELRTPLSAIRGSADTLLQAASELDPAETAQFHRIIRDQCEHMRYLIGDLLDVAHIATGTLAVDPQPSDLSALVDEATTGFQREGNLVSLHTDIPPDLPQVLADRQRVVQVIASLVSNAARHSPQPSAITITAERDGVYVAVSVADDGAGMRAEGIADLFRRFSPLEGNKSGHETGASGLRLAICKGIVEIHGGRVWAHSDGPGLGSRYTFTIPSVDKPATEASRPSGRSRRSVRKHPRVLCVDSDPQTLRYIRDALSKIGYIPIVTTDPNDVTPLIQEEDPHLVLLDLQLPGIDSIELMTHIRKSTDLPVILLSRYGQDELIAQAFRTGAADYLVKPFSPTELAARIRTAHRRRVVPEPIEPSQPYRLADLTIDYPQHEVTLAGHPLRLTPIEYRVLTELSANAGRTLTNAQLLGRVWGPNKTGSSAPVRNIIMRLRDKLGDDANNPTYIFNQPRIGYRMPKPED